MLSKKEIISFINKSVGIENLPIKYVLEYVKGYAKSVVVDDLICSKAETFFETVRLGMDEKRKVYEEFACFDYKTSEFWGVNRYYLTK